MTVNDDDSIINPNIKRAACTRHEDNQWHLPTKKHCGREMENPFCHIVCCAVRDFRSTYQLILCWRMQAEFV